MGKHWYWPYHYCLEELVANWDAISEALGFVDKEAERNAELIAEQDRAVRS